MADNSFYCLSERGVEKCALKQCEQLCEVPNTLILYFSDRENVCIYDRKEVPLSVNLADTLRHLLLACSEYNPGIRRQFHTFFERFDDNGEVRADAFRQCISSLHGKLAKIGLTDVIVQARLAGETAYYIKEQLFLVALPRG